MTSMKNRLRRLENDGYVRESGPDVVLVVGIDPQTRKETESFTIKIKKGEKK